MSKSSYDKNLSEYNFFRWKNQIHDTKKLLSLIQFLSPEEAEIFDIDMRKIDLDLNSRLMYYGIARYYLGNDVLSPIDPLKQVLRLTGNSELWHDANFAIKQTATVRKRDLSSFYAGVLDSQSF